MTPAELAAALRAALEVGEVDRPLLEAIAEHLERDAAIAEAKR